jgi:hypothetical protein
MGETSSKKALEAPSAALADKKTLPLMAVQQAISSIQFGIVQVIIQDGRIVQIDKTEKIRLI